MKQTDQGCVIKISQNALIQMVLNGLEAFSIYHQRGDRKLSGLETYGLLWGQEVQLPDHSTVLNIDLVSIDTSAIMSKSTCEPNDGALHLKRDIMTSFWPEYDFMGDFHTHPYRFDYRHVLRKRLYQFSAEDAAFIENCSADWIRHNYRVSLVLSIAKLRKASSKPDGHLNASTIEFTLGNYRMWLKGGVTYEVSENQLKLSEEGVILDCPALLGLHFEHTAFGKGTNNRFKNSRHIVGEI